MQRYVNLVDLVKSFPTSIYLQKSASIHPRTSLSKFGGKFNSVFIRVLRSESRKLLINVVKLRKDRLKIGNDAFYEIVKETSSIVKAKSSKHFEFLVVVKKMKLLSEFLEEVAEFSSGTDLIAAEVWQNLLQSDKLTVASKE